MRAHSAPYTLTSGERQALAFVAKVRGGRVVAPWYLAAALPAYAGRAALPDSLTVGELFAGRLSEATALDLLAATRANVVVSDCADGSVNLAALLGPAGFQVRRFGCAWVYALPSAVPRRDPVAP